MEATASGALLRRVPFAPRRAAGDWGMTPVRSLPARVKMENKFRDQGHLRYYAAAAATPARCGPKKEDKRRMKLVKGLEKDLSALYSMGFDDVGQDQGQTISEAAELLLAQLTKLRAEAKEAKQRRKQEKAAMKAAKMKDRAAAESSSSSSSESSSSESSDSECETAAKISRNSLRTAAAASDPLAAAAAAAAAALQTEDVIEEAKSNLALNLEPRCCSGGAGVALKPTEGKIEVCMGGKCKKSGAMELMAEFEKKVGAEVAVVGCKCMGKCRDGPNVRVVNAAAAGGDALMMKIVKGPLCIGVGLEDVGPIVAEFLGESHCVGLQPA